MCELTLVGKHGNTLFIQYIGGGTERTEEKKHRQNTQKNT